MKSKKLKKFLFSLVFIVILACCFSISAYADWDGSGLASGGSASAVSGSFTIPYDDIDDIVGYRFSIYDKDGDKLGNGIDLFFDM